MRESGPAGTSAVASSEVIAAAAEIIRESGIAGLTIEVVASALEVEPRDVRYWFISEADILAALMTVRQERFLAEVQERNAHASSHRARLCGLFDLCVEDYDATLWIELWKMSLREPVAREARQRINDRYAEMLTRMIRSGQAAGEFGDAPAAQTAYAMAAMVVGLAVLATLRDPTVSPDYMRETLVSAAGRLLDARLR